MKIIEGLNEWMRNEYGFSWDEYEETLLNEGSDNDDITEEFTALLENWRVETK